MLIGDLLQPLSQHREAFFKLWHAGINRGYCSRLLFGLPVAQRHDIRLKRRHPCAGVIGFQRDRRNRAAVKDGLNGCDHGIKRVCDLCCHQLVFTTIQRASVPSYSSVANEVAAARNTIFEPVKVLIRLAAVLEASSFTSVMVCATVL